MYQMSLDDGVWKLWREAPGFWRRWGRVFRRRRDGQGVPGRAQRKGRGGGMTLT